MRSVLKETIEAEAEVEGEEEKVLRQAQKLVKETVDTLGWSIVVEVIMNKIAQWKNMLVGVNTMEQMHRAQASIVALQEVMREIKEIAEYAETERS